VSVPLRRSTIRWPSPTAIFVRHTRPRSTSTGARRKEEWTRRACGRGRDADSGRCRRWARYPCSAVTGGSRTCVRSRDSSSVYDERDSEHVDRELCRVSSRGDDNFSVDWNTPGWRFPAPTMWGPGARRRTTRRPGAQVARGDRDVHGCGDRRAARLWSAMRACRSRRPPEVAHHGAPVCVELPSRRTDAAGGAKSQPKHSFFGLSASCAGGIYDVGASVVRQPHHIRPLSGSRPGLCSRRER
jgi:hypothetical protein